MDLTTEAIKELKHAFDALPRQMDSDRVAATEVLELLQSLSPPINASAHQVLNVIRRVTAEAASATPAAASNSAAVDAPVAALGGRASGLSSSAGAALQGAMSPASPRSPAARPALPPALPAAAMSPPVDAVRSSCSIGVACVKHESKATPRKAGVPPNTDPLLPPGGDGVWGDGDSDLSDDPEEEAASAAAAAAPAAVRDSYLRTTFSGGRRGSVELVGASERRSVDAHTKGDKTEGGSKSHHHRPHHRRHHSIRGEAPVDAADDPPSLGEGSVLQSTPASPALHPLPPPVPRAGGKSPRWVPAKVLPIPSHVSTASLRVSSSLRRFTSGGSQGDSAAVAASQLPSLDFREFLLVVVQLRRRLDAAAGVAGHGGGPPLPAEGNTVGGSGSDGGGGGGGGLDPAVLPWFVFQVLVAAEREVLLPDDLQRVLTGFGGEAVSADQAMAMTELAASAGMVGVGRAVAHQLPPGVEGASFLDFSAVYEMVQRVNRDRAAEEAAAAAARSARRTRGDPDDSSDSSLFKWFRSGRTTPPSPPAANGGPPPMDLPPAPPRPASTAVGRGVECPVPSRSSGHDKGGAGGSPRPEGRLRQWAKTLRPHSGSSASSKASRSSRPQSTSTSSYSTGNLRSAAPAAGAVGRTAAAPHGQEEGATVSGANLV